MLNFADLLQASQELRIARSEPTAKSGSHQMYSLEAFENSALTCADIGMTYTQQDEIHTAGIVAYAVISMLCTSSVALMMKNNKQLMAHPNKLIFYMCICEGIIAWQAMLCHLGPEHVICYMKLDRLYRWTWPWAGNETQTLHLLARTNFNLLSFFEFLSLSLNLCLCLDIVFTMRNPFYPHDRRMKFYLPCSMLLATLAFELSLKRKDERLSVFNNSQRALFSASFLSLYIILAITSVAYAYRVNTRPGMSTDVRRQFISRHLQYVSAYIATWLPYLGFSYFIVHASTELGPNLTYSELSNDPRF